MEWLPPGCLLVRMSDEVWHGYRQIGYWWGLSERCGVVTARLVTCEG